MRGEIRDPPPQRRWEEAGLSPVCSHRVPIPGVTAREPREGATGFVPPPGPRLTPASPPASVIMTGAYNNFFRMFDRNTKRDVTLEASRESSKPRAVLKPRRVCVGGKRRRDDISVDSLDFTKKILHTAWHPAENIIAIAATNNLYIFQDKVNSDMH